MNASAVLSLPYMDEALSRLEPFLEEQVRTGDDLLDDILTHLIRAGGKRLRPVLAIASGTRGSRSAVREDLLAGVAVELCHLASLYHDDVMDEATMRRGAESVNQRWGNLVAIVAGDFLLARSAEIAAGLGAEVAGLLANTLGQLCQGQLAEVNYAFRADRTRDAYEAAIAGKTAALMSTSCRMGALAAQLPRDEVEALTAYGQRFGMVFQLRDDVLDVVGDETVLGKPAGQDLAEGIYTLPVLIALQDPSIGPELAALLTQPLDEPAREKARVLVASSPGISGAMTVGRAWADEAAQAARAVPSPELSAALAELAHSLLDDIPTD